MANLVRANILFPASMPKVPNRDVLRYSDHILERGTIVLTEEDRCFLTHARPAARRARAQ